MAFNNRNIDDLVRIAMAGGGFSLPAASKTTDELTRIAAAGSNRGARLVFTGMTNRDVNDLARIAMAGQGCVQFAD